MNENAIETKDVVHMITDALCIIDGNTNPFYDKYKNIDFLIYADNIKRFDSGFFLQIQNNDKSIKNFKISIEEKEDM